MSCFREHEAEQETQHKDPGIETVGPGFVVDQADICPREFCKAAIMKWYFVRSESESKIPFRWNLGIGIRDSIPFFYLVKRPKYIPLQLWIILNR